MSFQSLPELVTILWMALVLARLRRTQSNDQVHLWIIGLFLFVVEGFARILYLLPLSPVLHATMHVVALDSYFLAGVAFLRSATGRLRLLKHNVTYLLVCASPHIVLLTMYGANVRAQAWFLGVTIYGLIASCTMAITLGRRRLFLICHILVWGSLITAASLGNFRVLAYMSLFYCYLATAIAFFCTLPRHRKGRVVVVAGFCIWSLCFITHPWIAENRPSWVFMAERIWDMQKFFIMFGLLIVSLEEHSATNEYQALHDTLTGLPNRRLFEDRLEQAIARAQRSNSRVVLYNMDMDAFKKVNDTFGHDAGDELLREVGRRLHRVTRESDTLARMGGDEFNLLIGDFYPANSQTLGESRAQAVSQAWKVCESFRRAVESTPCIIRIGETEHALPVQVSIGCVIFPDETSDRNELCRLADQKMYADKKARGGVGGGLSVGIL